MLIANEAAVKVEFSRNIWTCISINFLSEL